MKIMKNFITNKFDDTYDSMMKFVSRTYSSTKQYINSAFLLSKDNIKEYYDIILQKVNHLIKRGKENYFEYRHADQQAELEVVCYFFFWFRLIFLKFFVFKFRLFDNYLMNMRLMKQVKLIMHWKPMVKLKRKKKKIVDEYHRCLGGKIIDTKCTEYTDEPRQNVVKFLGIPIVHMSKQPEIMIKVCSNRIFY